MLRTHGKTITNCICGNGDTAILYPLSVVCALFADFILDIFQDVSELREIFYSYDREFGYMFDLHTFVLEGSGYERESSGYEREGAGYHREGSGSEGTKGGGTRFAVPFAHTLQMMKDANLLKNV